MKADCMIFDALKIEDTSTFENPIQFPRGIHHVFLNGAIVLENGEPTGSRNGQVLRF
jgi:N-acyl-D-amino-acid deacylase